MKSREKPFYVRLRRSSILFDDWMYFDVPDYYADNLFIKHKCPVSFGREYHKQNSPYRIILCRTLKLFRNRFEASMHELPYIMALNGHGDYEEFCTALINKIYENDKNKKAAK